MKGRKHHPLRQQGAVIQNLWTPNIDYVVREQTTQSPPSPKCTIDNLELSVPSEQETRTKSSSSQKKDQAKTDCVILERRGKTISSSKTASSS